jgi:hypothetical protein
MLTGALCLVLLEVVSCGQGNSITTKQTDRHEAMQLEMKQEFWKKRKEYAKKVDALNNSHFRKVRPPRAAQNPLPFDCQAGRTPSPCMLHRIHCGSIATSRKLRLLHTIASSHIPSALSICDGPCQLVPLEACCCGVSLSTVSLAPYHLLGTQFQSLRCLQVRERQEAEEDSSSESDGDEDLSPTFRAAASPLGSPSRSRVDLMARTSSPTPTAPWVRSS